MSNELNSKYQEAVNKAIDYIRENLSEKILLEDIADHVNISSFHFHRIFSSFIGETPISFVRRIRLEKAASLILNEPKTSITEIAYRVGYTSSQVFSTCFKEAFGCTASDYRKKYNRYSKILEKDSRKVELNSNENKGIPFKIEYNYSTGRPRITYKSKDMDMNVQVEELPETTVAYVRHIGPYRGDAELFGRLYEEISLWAGARKLLNKDTVMYSLYHEDCDITDDSKTMVDVCVSVPEDTKVNGNVGKQVIPGGEYAVAKLKIENAEDYLKAWDSLYKDWLPDSGYKPDDRPAFEMYRGDCRSENTDKDAYEHIAEICIPVKPQ